MDKESRLHCDRVEMEVFPKCALALCVCAHARVCACMGTPACWGSAPPSPKDVFCLLPRCRKPPQACCWALSEARQGRKAAKGKTVLRVQTIPACFMLAPRAPLHQVAGPPDTCHSAKPPAWQKQGCCLTLSAKGLLKTLETPTWSLPLGKVSFREPLTELCSLQCFCMNYSIKEGSFPPGTPLHTGFPMTGSFPRGWQSES